MKKILTSSLIASGLLISGFACAQHPESLISIQCPTENTVFPDPYENAEERPGKWVHARIILNKSHQNYDYPESITTGILLNKAYKEVSSGCIYQWAYRESFDCFNKDLETLKEQNPHKIVGNFYGLEIKDNYSIETIKTPESWLGVDPEDITYTPDYPGPRHGIFYDMTGYVDEDVNSWIHITEYLVKYQQERLKESPEICVSYYEQ